MSVVDILEELVATSSVSRESNRPIIALAQKHLARIGWSYREHAYRDPQGVDKVNLVAWPGDLSAEPNEYRLALVCHTDTVPYAEAWKEATTLTADGERLKGCGACDVKAFLACILAVAGQLSPGGLRNPLAIILTADEEIGCIGARHLVTHKALHTRYAIIGEPTSLQPMRAGKGYYLAVVTVRGREAHSAYPEQGVSAIFGAARLIGKIEKIAEHLRQDRDQSFSPAWTTLNIGEIQGGLAKNIVPPVCTFLLEWRPIAGQDADLVPGLVRMTIANLQKTDPDFTAVLEVTRTQEGFATDSQSALVHSLEQASGRQAGSVAFGTEAPWLHRLGAEPVIFGPGSMLSAHSPNEFVPAPELFRCVEILATVIRDLCG